MTRNSKSEPSKGQAPASTTIRFTSLILVCLTIIALGAVAYFTERGIVVSRDWVIHTYQVWSHLNDLQLEVMRAQANETNSLLLAGTQSLPPPPSRLIWHARPSTPCAHLPRTTLGSNSVCLSLGKYSKTTAISSMASAIPKVRRYSFPPANASDGRRLALARNKSPRS